MNKLSAKESGSVIIIVAVMMFVLLGIAAFAVDFGYQYVVKNQVQNSADAAALAGADVLSEMPSILSISQVTVVLLVQLVNQQVATASPL